MSVKRFIETVLLFAFVIGTLVAIYLPAYYSVKLQEAIVASSNEKPELICFNLLSDNIQLTEYELDGFDVVYTLNDSKYRKELYFCKSL